MSTVTFANFGKRKCAGAKRNFALAGHSSGANAADAWHPTSLRKIELVSVDFESYIYLDRGNPGWLSGSDCIDMDCDGPKVRIHAFSVSLQLLDVLPWLFVLARRTLFLKANSQLAQCYESKAY